MNTDLRFFMERNEKTERTLNDHRKQLSTYAAYLPPALRAQAENVASSIKAHEIDISHQYRNGGDRRIYFPDFAYTVNRLAQTQQVLCNQLQQLPQIGPARAHVICDGLGSFYVRWAVTCLEVMEAPESFLASRDGKLYYNKASLQSMRSFIREFYPGAPSLDNGYEANPLGSAMRSILKRERMRLNGGR